MNYFAATRLNPAIGIVILVLALLTAGRGVSWTAPFIFMILCAISLLLYPIYVRFRLKQCYKRTRIGDGSRVLDLDQNSIKIREANVKSELEWTAIRYVKEDKKVIMIYIAPAKFIMIPKTACFEEQRRELQALFQQNVRAVAQ